MPEHTATIEAIPEWHDRPTEPGWWVWFDEDKNLVGACWTQAEVKMMDEGEMTFDGPAYGPIPEDTDD